MKFAWLNVRLARTGLLAALITITTLALLPTQSVPVGSGWDKLDHWTAFFTLSLLASHAYPQRPFWQIALALLSYGIGIEVAQYFTPDRSADAMDVVADSIGIIIYGLIQFIGAAISRTNVSTE